MIRAVLACVALLVASLTTVSARAVATPEPLAGAAKGRSAPAGVWWVAGELLVRFRSAAAPAARRGVHARLGAGVVGRVPGFGVDRVRLPAGASVREGIRRYSADPAVAVVEPNYLRPPQEHIPNDELFQAQWGARNIGQLHPVTYSETPATFRSARTWRTRDYRTVTPRTESCTKAMSPRIRLRAI